ncbi:MAG: glucose-6-phosphate isomerase [Erysipelotrichales bacterium]|nr:glucose-6-phosphate isomerase [Erysipelotrichales bacterium]
MKLNLEKAFLQESVLEYQSEVTRLHEALHNKTGKGNDFVGWVEWPNTYDKEEFERIKVAAKKIRENCDILVVCGIGGSYLGARAAIEMINGLYSDDKMEVIFLGNTFSSTYIKQVMNYIEGKKFAVNVISKSGTTTETSIAFRLLKQLVEKQYGKENAKEYIYATTDKARGTLKALADQEGYETFVIPDDIGGRFSVTTAVGLLPIACAGIDIDEVMKGAKDAYHDFNTDDLNQNIAYQYAVARRILEKQGKVAEMLVSYELQMTMIAEWWKQLFGESEGKEGKGLIPYSGTFSTDLHSLGQFVQDGNKVMFETVINVERPTLDIEFPSDEENMDHMNYLAGKSVHWVNQMAALGTLDAHVDTGNVPNILLTIEDMSAYTFGYMTYFFFKAIAMTAYLLDINPFNQPGVEVYKKNMFKLLGKN